MRREKKIIESFDAENSLIRQMKKKLSLVLICFFALQANQIKADLILFDFLSHPIGEKPSGWQSSTGGFSNMQGKWEILVDDVPSLAPGIVDGNTGLKTVKARVVAQTAKISHREHFPMLVYSDALCKDFTFSLKFKIESGLVSQMAGICFRYVDPENYYVIRASAKDATLRFYKYFQGLRGDPFGPEVKIPVGEWVDLKVQAKGANFQAWLNGEKAFQAPVEDYAFDKGLVGIWTKSDSITHFHDLRLDYTPLITMGQRLVNMAADRYPDFNEISLYTIEETDGFPVNIASSQSEKLGLKGGKEESDAIANKNTYRARGKNRITTVTLPLEDRNGEPIAALKVVYKGFRGESSATSRIKALKVAQYIQSNLGVANLSDK